MTRTIAACWAALILLCAAPATAQQRPLVTEDPETIGGGRVLVEAGLEYGHGVEFPASGLQGNLLRLPLIGVSIGLSSIAEIQIDGGFHNRLTVTDRVDGPLADMLDFEGDSTTDVEDIVVGTKIRLLGETRDRPALGLRLATRLPNAGNESGLGLDTTDFHVSALVGKTIQSIRVVGNLGMGILGDPTRGDRQNDVLTYGVSVARAIVEGFEVVSEINGRVDTRAGDPPPGTESRSIARVGARYTYGAGRVDAGLLFGLTGRDPSVGVMAGYTHVFDAFQLP
jgi:hypothetical protein